MQTTLQNMITRNFIVLLVFYACIGCETVVDIELPPHESRLVVNSIFTPDSTWTVQLSSSVAYTDTTFGRAPWVESGTVEIWQGNERIETLENLGSGSYRGVTQPDPESRYQVRAFASGWDAVEGESSVPTGTLIESIQTQLLEVEERSSGRLDGEIEFMLMIKDRPAIDEYFNIRVIEVKEQPRQDLSVFYDSSYTSFSTSDLALTSGDPLDTEESQVFYDDAYFSDELFDGESYELRLSVEFRRRGSPDHMLRFYVQLLTLSEDFYFYQVSSDLQRGTDQDPFTEPVDVYSNMSSGFGIFAGYHSQVFPVPLSFE